MEIIGKSFFVVVVWIGKFVSFRMTWKETPTFPKLSEKKEIPLLNQIGLKMKKGDKKRVYQLLPGHTSFNYWYIKLIAIDSALNFELINPTHSFQNWGRGSQKSSQNWKPRLHFCEVCPLLPIDTKLESAGSTIFYIKLPGSCKTAIGYVKFWFRLLNVWPRPVSCPK